MRIAAFTSTILREMPEINKWVLDFFDHHLELFLSIRGWYTYLNFECCGAKNEMTYHNYHNVGIDFQKLNLNLKKPAYSPITTIFSNANCCFPSQTSTR